MATVRGMRSGAIAIVALVAAALGATLALVQVALSVTRGAPDFSLSVAGAGVLMLVSALILLLSGAIGELIYQRGDLRDREFSKLTQSVRQQAQ